MAVSEKQMIANRQNALRSTGPKTADGKALAARNSLKHGLLAKEVVITEGEGAEDQQTFDALLADLVIEFNPAGAMEEILVEEIAVCYWRQHRAHRCEVGMLRQKLDLLSADYYARQGNRTDAQIDAEIDKKQAQIKTALDKMQMYKQACTIGQDLSSIYRWKDDWIALRETHLAPTRKVYTVDGEVAAVITLTPAEAEQIGPDPEKIRKKLNEKGHPDDHVWQMHMDLCQKEIERKTVEIEKLQKDKVANRLCLQRTRQSSALPPKSEMDKLLRYETAINRQMYQAMSQLERLQRLRAGDHVPAPVQVDLDVADLNVEN